MLRVEQSEWLTISSAIPYKLTVMAVKQEQRSYGITDLKYTKLLELSSVWQNTGSRT